MRVNYVHGTKTPLQVQCQTNLGGQWACVNTQRERIFILTSLELLHPSLYCKLELTMCMISIVNEMR